MDTLSTRALVSQLAEDLAWLEQHARQQGDQDHVAGLLRLAATVVRNCIGPFIDNQPSTPLHVVVVGGAGAGKSTVANMLAGSILAESNPQAGFTRHPIAYTSATGTITWASHLGFLGPLTRLTQPSPSSLDQDVYQVRRIPTDGNSGDLLHDWVVWDCPDMTTWAAEGYIPRLLEAAGLADVIVYVASDERYNDVMPTQFLEMLLHAGKPVVCCLMKMKEADASALIAHFQKAVLGNLADGANKGIVSVLPIPQLTPKQLADPIREAAKWRIPLLNQVAVLGNPEDKARRRTVTGATRFLVKYQKRLLEVARSDVQALESWQHLVHSGQQEFDSRYQREYLSSEKFQGFDEALVRLMQLLELPGIGQIVSGTLTVLRLPYQWIRGLIGKAMARPDAPTRPEQPILEESLAAWIDQIRKEVLRRQKEHALWSHLATGFSTGKLTERAREKFQSLYRDFQAALAQEVDRTARAIYEKLEKQPLVLNTLRTGKLALDATVIGGAIMAGGIGYHDIVLVPLVASLTHQLVEVLGKQIVDSEREATRQRQLVLLHQHLTTPMANWLIQWPSTGGSAFERLQLALRRLPESIQQLEFRVRDVMSPVQG